ncbi:MAG: terminase small subunit [Smithellaceae bacterium]
MRKKRKLTIRQKLFVREYLVDLNATRAYLRAGYKVNENIARRNGARLLTNADILEAIHQAIGNQLSKLEITNETVLQEIAKLAFCNMFDYISINKDGTAVVDFLKLTREQAAAIQELSFEEGMEAGVGGAKPVKKVKFKLSDKKGSLELLGKYLKLFSDTTPAISPKVEKILNDVLSETMTAREASYQITMLGLPLPEVLKIELSKIQPEPPPPEVPPSMSDEELERRYQENLRKNEEEKETWLPARQAEVKKLKDDLKDIESFGPNAEQKIKGRE